MIGIQKDILLKIVKAFEMAEIFEFSSLAFAAMPYRFLFLSVNSWSTGMTIIGVKFIYKFVWYVLSLKYKTEIKDFKIRTKKKIFFWKTQEQVKAFDQSEIYLSKKQDKYLNE